MGKRLIGYSVHYPSRTTSAERNISASSANPHEDRLACSCCPCNHGVQIPKVVDAFGRLHVSPILPYADTVYVGIGKYERVPAGPLAGR